MKNKFLFFLAMAAVLFTGGCSRWTPTIHGVVVDAATGKPVPGAWVMATIDVFTENVAGGAYNTRSLSAPHTRTKEDGSFELQAKKIPRFLSRPDDLNIWVFVMDGREAKVVLKGAKLQKFMPFLWGTENMTIPVEVVKRDAKEENYHLQTLFDYCSYGRFLVGPVVKGGCDAWELDYVIARHEWFLEANLDGILEDAGKIEELNKPGSILVEIVHTIERVGQLYEKKGDDAKRMEVYKKGAKLMEPLNLPEKGMMAGMRYVFQENAKMLEKRLGK